MHKIMVINQILQINIFKFTLHTSDIVVKTTRMYNRKHVFLGCKVGNFKRLVAIKPWSLHNDAISLLETHRSSTNLYLMHVSYFSWLHIHCPVLICPLDIKVADVLLLFFYQHLPTPVDLLVVSQRERICCICKFKPEDINQLGTDLNTEEPEISQKEKNTCNTECTDKTNNVLENRQLTCAPNLLLYLLVYQSLFLKSDRL